MYCYHIIAFFFTNYWKSTLQIPYIKYKVQWIFILIVSSSGMLCRQIWRMANKVSEVQNLGLPEHRASYLIFWTKLIIQTILSCFDTTVTIKRWQSDFILMEMKISVCINNLIKMILVKHWLEIIWLHFVLFIICTKEETGRRMHFTQFVSISTICTETEFWFYPFKAKSSIRMKCHPSFKYSHYNHQFTHTFSKKKWHGTFHACYIFKNKTL